jgi:hypothetical protein
MSAISWTDHSFAPWFGCTRVSPACDHCYAETWTVGRFGKAGWGPRSPWVRSAPSQKPLAWNRAAARRGAALFVFCSELSDVFDNQAPDAWRADLWRLIRGAWLAMPSVKTACAWNDVVELSKDLRRRVTDVVLDAWEAGGNITPPIRGGRQSHEPLEERADPWAKRQREPGRSFGD